MRPTRTSPPRRALHERSDSQANEEHGPTTVRLVDDDLLYRTSALPSHPAHVLAPPSAPDPSLKGWSSSQPSLSPPSSASGSGSDPAANDARADHLHADSRDLARPLPVPPAGWHVGVRPVAAAPSASWSWTSSTGGVDAQRDSSAEHGAGDVPPPDAPAPAPAHPEWSSSSPHALLGSACTPSTSMPRPSSSSGESLTSPLRHHRRRISRPPSSSSSASSSFYSAFPPIAAPPNAAGATGLPPSRPLPSFARPAAGARRPVGASLAPYLHHHARPTAAAHRGVASRASVAPPESGRIIPLPLSPAPRSGAGTPARTPSAAAPRRATSGSPLVRRWAADRAQEEEAVASSRGRSSSSDGEDTDHRSEFSLRHAHPLNLNPPTPPPVQHEDVDVDVDEDGVGCDPTSTIRVVSGSRMLPRDPPPMSMLLSTPHPDAHAHPPPPPPPPPPLSPSAHARHDASRRMTYPVRRADHGARDSVVLTVFPAWARLYYARTGCDSTSDPLEILRRQQQSPPKPFDHDHDHDHDGRRPRRHATRETWAAASPSQHQHQHQHLHSPAGALPRLHLHTRVPPQPLPALVRRPHTSTLDEWSPHLAPHPRSPPPRLSIWQAPAPASPHEAALADPPDHDDDDGDGDGCLSRRRLQIVLFCLGFLCPLAWWLAAFWPLPFDPHPERRRRGRDRGRGRGAGGARPDPTFFAAGWLEQEKEIDRIEERRYDGARWWRNLNRVMALVGLVVVALVIAMAVVAARTTRGKS
ncbi:MAG: hypothetical protein M1826_002441 [Phylliscum demangeonii]|nr:MAG: hypothetical protein M1826_002441 [Phylliscum demangeonii]